MSKKGENERRILYIGLDDSNPGIYPELCLAYFSTIPGDFSFDKFLFRRNPRLLSRLQSPKRDYRFLLFSEGDVVLGINNLAIAAPSLIWPYLEEHVSYEELRIAVDGRFNSRSKAYTRQELFDFSGAISIAGHIKYKNGHGKNKSYQQPRILAFADAEVHNLASSLSLDQLRAHEKRVPLRI